MKKKLIQLRNAIKGDYSLHRYTLGWEDVIKAIESRYKDVPVTPEEFTNRLLIEAIQVTKGRMRATLESYARELKLNLEALSEKPITTIYKG